jgi:tetratricopeptide (TPR) repeat protein
MLKKNQIFAASCLSLTMTMTILSLSHYIQPATAKEANLVLVKNADAVQKLIDSGIEKYSQEDYKGSIIDYTAAIKLAPNQIELYYYRAESYQRMKNYKSALADLATALKIEPKNVYYNYHRALVKQEMGDLKGAIADMTVYLNGAKPEDSKGLYSWRGGLYQKVGDHQKAIADFTVDIKLQGPSFSADIHRLRADSYLVLKNKPAAIKDLQTAIQLYKKMGPDADSLREATIKELAKLK